jgi:hypothetical protein
MLEIRNALMRTNTNLTCWVLAAGQCLVECKEWDMCLAVLGEDETAATGPMQTDEPSPVC